MEHGILEFIPAWQKDTALHKFIRYIADGILESDNSGRRKIRFGDPMNPKWTLPIEVALALYGIQERIQFEIPDFPQIEKREGNIFSYEDPPELFDACYDYFLELRLTQAYQDILRKISDEVFFVMFTNRAALQDLHEFLSMYVLECDQEYIEAEYPNLRKLFTKTGRLQRRDAPEWARRAVYFRDRGMCTQCKRDISGLLNPFAKENYDHIMPLSKGGLNDVTNLQLLCRPCNREKSDRLEPVSNSYVRWF
ncbi:hypothetical protein GCM10027074_38700 [Streptomyces deserti]